MASIIRIFFRSHFVFECEFLEAVDWSVHSETKRVFHIFSMGKLAPQHSRIDTGPIPCCAGQEQGCIFIWIPRFSARGLFLHFYFVFFFQNIAFA